MSDESEPKNEAEVCVAAKRTPRKSLEPLLIGILFIIVGAFVVLRNLFPNPTENADIMPTHVVFNEGLENFSKVYVGSLAFAAGIDAMLVDVARRASELYRSFEGSRRVSFLNAIILNPTFANGMLQGNFAQPFDLIYDAVGVRATNATAAVAISGEKFSLGG